MPNKSRRGLPASLLPLAALGALAALLVILTVLRAGQAGSAAVPAALLDAPMPIASAQSGGAAAPVAASAEAPATAEAAPTPTPAPTPVPEPEYFTISMVGDCTLASAPDKKGWAIAYESVINGDLAYPFANTRDIFEKDYLTIANLECTLSDRAYSSIEWFTFLAPASYAGILTEGCVDFVTLANNHTMDFGAAAYQDTLAALAAVELPCAGDDETYIYQESGGLKVGLYCLYNQLTYNTMSLLSAQQRQQLAENARSKLLAAEKALRQQGAEYVVALLHMGREGYYEPTDVQTELCRHAIDVGFDLVYCSHSHRLQPAEPYGDGLIFYGLGNWTFGGHTNPGNGTDPGAYDTGIAQVTLCRRGDSVTLDSYTFLPCSISSAKGINNYQPTLYEEGSADWERTMSMLNGTYEGGNYNVDYGNILAAMNG